MKAGSLMGITSFKKGWISEFGVTPISIEKKYFLTGRKAPIDVIDLFYPEQLERMTGRGGARGECRLLIRNRNYSACRRDSRIERFIFRHKAVVPKTLAAYIRFTL
jgi:hypothetical protein